MNSISLKCECKTFSHVVLHLTSILTLQTDPAKRPVNIWSERGVPISPLCHLFYFTFVFLCKSCEDEDADLDCINPDHCFLS